MENFLGVKLPTCFFFSFRAKLGVVSPTEGDVWWCFHRFSGSGFLGKPALTGSGWNPPGKGDVKNQQKKKEIHGVSTWREKYPLATLRSPGTKSETFSGLDQSNPTELKKGLCGNKAHLMICQVLPVNQSFIHHHRYRWCGQKSGTKIDKIMGVSQK